MNIERKFDTKIAVERQRSFKDFTKEDIDHFWIVSVEQKVLTPCINGYAHIITTGCIYLRSSNGCIILISNQIQDKNRL